MIELIYQNNSNGKAHELSNIVSNVEWSTFKVGAPSKLEIQIAKGYATTIGFVAGSIVALKYNGKGVFYGYLFNINTDMDQIKLTFYDQLRYLTASATYVFKNARIKDIVTAIALDFGLKVGSLDNPSYTIKPLIQDNKKILDIILTALDDLLINTNQQYVLFDDYGALSLKKPQDLAIPYLLGDKSLATSYSHTASIEESFNFIKLIKDNKDTGEREAYIVKDSSNMVRWGKLQYFEIVDEKMNAGQIKQQADLLLELHNRVKQSLDINGIGNIEFRGGRACYVNLTDTGQKGWYVIEEAKHSFKGTQHDMSLKMKVV